MIRAENISYTYREGISDGVKAVDNISLTIPDGSVTALIGHTGSGKSTLIQLIAALISPDEGKIFIDDMDITDKKTDYKRVHRTVGIVFQYPEHQLFEETVYRDIAFGPKNLGLSEEETDLRVKKAASLMGITQARLEASPFDLSGGQKRRAAIAGVLAMEPNVLILDEPAAGLDPRGRDNILRIIKNLHETHKDMIIIFVSHSMEDVAKIADSVIVMNQGAIEMRGSVSDVFRRAERLREIGLNVPQVALIAERLRNAGYNLPEDIYTVKHAAEAIFKMSGGDADV